MRPSIRWAALLAFALVVAACSGGADTTTTTVADEPTATTTAAPVALPVVKIGSVNSLTGPFPFPEASAAAQAVFDRYNSDPDRAFDIEYFIEDDAADPAIASQAARKIVTQDGIALLAGGASLLDCAVNGGFYAENGLYAVQGTGVDEVCFASRNIAPVNTGPYVGLTVSLYFMSEILGHESICYVQFDTGTGAEPRAAAIARWEKITGNTLTSLDLYPPGDDLTPYVVKAMDSGCTGVFEGGLDFTAIAWDQAVATQGATFDSVHFTSAYTAGFAEAVPNPATPTYANSEFEPFTDLDSPALTDWRALMEAAGVPLTSFAEGGYLAGLIAIDIVENAGITADDDLTTQRSKIEQSLLTMEPFENPMLGVPYIFGDAEAHSPNYASKFVQLIDGAWVTVTDEFVILPDES